MKPAPFSYLRPESLDEAIALLAKHGSDAKIIAGGQSLMPMLAFRLAAPDYLIDIGRVQQLKRMDIGPDGIELGALVCWRDIEKSPQLAQAHPLLAEAVRHVAHYQIRNRGTVGGSLAHADPAAELPAVALACEATITAAGPKGTRSIAAAGFFSGALTTALEPDEILLAVRFPAWPAQRRWEFEEFARRKGDFAIAGVALFYDTDADGRAREPHIAAMGVSGTPVRLTACEDALAGRRLDGHSIEEIARLAPTGLEMHDDIHAPADYRAALLTVLVERALTRAAGLREAA
jgi:carbon-monoxide dehydrogenase medium subunit